MVKLISGGGSSFANALANSQNKLSIDPCKEKCLYVISNISDICELKLATTKDGCLFLA